jgi:hypothetical protein
MLTSSITQSQLFHVDIWHCSPDGLLQKESYHLGLLANRNTRRMQARISRARSICLHSKALVGARHPISARDLRFHLRALHATARSGPARHADCRAGTFSVPSSRPLWSGRDAVITPPKGRGEQGRRLFERDIDAFAPEAVTGVESE